MMQEVNNVPRKGKNMVNELLAFCRSRVNLVHGCSDSTQGEQGNNTTVVVPEVIDESFIRAA